jgi:hypothetical protein
VPAWPAITEPELVDRLTLTDEQFAELWVSLATGLGSRPFTPDVYRHAVGYPWSRPERSYVLRGGMVELLDELNGRRRADAFGSFMDTSPRTPLLAFGSNAAPSVLERKFAHFGDAGDRNVLVLAGRLMDFDVGASAQPTTYGSLPATLFPSPGTAVRAAILWLTPAQFTQLVWSELSYGLGRLQTTFEADEPELSVGDVIAFVSRFGAFAPEGQPTALAAIPAERRAATALTQEQVLDAAAALALGANARGQALVREVFENFSALMPKLVRSVRRSAQPFASPRWTWFDRYAAAQSLGRSPLGG